MAQEANRGERTLAAYAILVTCARNRQTMTYGQLGDLVGTTAQNVPQSHLTPIDRYCEANGLPRLMTLVVSALDGYPYATKFGDGLYQLREAVYRHNWTRTPLPSIQDLTPNG